MKLSKTKKNLKINKNLEFSPISRREKKDVCTILKDSKILDRRKRIEKKKDLLAKMMPRECNESPSAIMRGA